VEATAPVTVEQAAAALGVSASTVHRRIRSGALKAEQAERPQGKVWMVHLPPGTTVASGELPPPSEPEAAASTTMAPAAEAMVSLIQTTIGTILGPLVGQLDAQRQTIDRQAEELRTLERDNGRLTAELTAAQAQNSVLLASGAPDPQKPTLGGEPSRPWWPSWWPWVLMVLAVLATVVVLLAAPR
jgi:hypothetical protein